MRVHGNLRREEDTEKLEDFLERLKKRVEGKNNVEIIWPHCEECDCSIFELNFYWDQTEEERIELEKYRQECEENATKWEREQLAILKAKYETTS